MKVRTILGDIDPEEIGISLIHEHLFFEKEERADLDQTHLGFDVQKAELSIFQEQGGNCVVDQTTIDMGRQPGMLRRLAESMQVHIVASTGYYHEEWYPDFVRQSDAGTIAEVMTNEIERAVEGGTFRAGMIGEIGSSEAGTTANEAKVLKAAARAHMATGAPISTHTMAGSEALHQLEILAREGVDPRKVIISHIGFDHVEHVRMIAGEGAFLGFDTIGKPRFRDEYRMTGDEIQLEVLCALVDAGHEDQIVLSHDVSRPGYLQAYGGKGYGHLLRDFVPRLRERLPEEKIEKFLIHNPRRALSF